MTNYDTDSARWSLAGQAIVWLIVAELGLAVVCIANPEFHRPRMLVTATATVLGSAIVAARSRIPVQIKAGSIALLSAALLSFAAAVDPFGLRAIDQRIEDATQADQQIVADATAPASTTAMSISPQIQIRGKGDAAGIAFSDDLARTVSERIGGDTGPYQVHGMIDISSDAGGDTYRLTWSLGGPRETLWCGRIVATGQTRAAALDRFGSAIVGALRQSRNGAATCG